MADAMLLHPGLSLALKRLTSDELGVARLMASGELSSPQRYENVELFALRVTGTGLSYRQDLDEHVWRNPENYLNSEFLARCNGLPVIWEHPPRAVLDGDEFARRIIGTVFLAYVQKSEVWAIAKIYDREAARLMEEGQLSTSPSVVFRDETVNDRLQSEDGRSLLFEGKPSLLDHLAVCELGVWDKGGSPAGVRSDSQGNRQMEDEPEDKAKGAGDGEKLDKVLEHLGSMSSSMENLTSRMDAMEAKSKADTAKKADDSETEEQKLARMREEDDRPSKRADSLVQRRADDAALAGIQGRADAAFNLHGKRAPMPLEGERPLGYRVRMANELKRYSPALDGVDLGAVARADASGFEALETRIYTDSEKASLRPEGPEDGGLIMRERRNPDTGGPVREFFGRGTFIREMSPTPRPVMRINAPGVLANA